VIIPLLQTAIVPLQARHRSEQNRCILRVIDGSHVRRDDLRAGGAFVSPGQDQDDEGTYVYVPSGGSGGRTGVSNVIVLHEAFVSRRHFKLEFIEDEENSNDQSRSSAIGPQTPELGSAEYSNPGPGKWYLTDLGSTTGTYIMVPESDYIVLKLGMILQIGISEIKFDKLQKEDVTATNEYVLEVTEGPNHGCYITLNEDTVSTIGRDRACTLFINDKQISSVHAQVEYSRSRKAFVLKDSFSTNRTWHRLSPEGKCSTPHELQPGGVFKVGSTWFLHVSEEPMHNDGSQSNPLHTPEREEGHPQLLVGGPVQVVEELSPTILETRGSVETPRGNQPSTRQAETESFRRGRQPTELAASSLGAYQDPSFDSSQGQSPDQHHSVWAGLEYLESPSSNAPQHSSNTNTCRSSIEMDLQNSSAQIRYAKNQSSRSDDGTMCKICYERKLECVFVPCGHFMCCYPCAERVTQCPVCRADISMLQRVYDS